MADEPRPDADEPAEEPVEPVVDEATDHAPGPDLDDPDDADATAPLADAMLDEARRALEAIVMVADQPAEPALLAQLVELSPGQVEDLLAGLSRSYEEEGRGFQLVRVAGGWRYQSHEDLSPYVERFVLSGQSARLSAAALETMAIVAYKQPISRAQVAAIRGVNVDGVMRTLQQRGYIDEVARDTGPGQAAMFGTTSLFLERLGINALDELPSLGDFIPGADVVEMLEHGLRAEPDDVEGQPSDPDADGEEADAGPTDAGPADVAPTDLDADEASDDDRVVDVTEPVTIDVDALTDDLADDHSG